METTAERNVRKLYEGHVPVDETLAKLELTLLQRVERALIVSIIGAVRPLYWTWRRLFGRPFVSAADVADEFEDAPTTRGVRSAESHGAPYLAESEIEEYERQGILGPFRVLSTAEAADLRSWLESQHDDDWQGKHPIGTKTVEELKKNGLWALDHSALWQERNFARVRDIARHPELASRVASLLGDEVVTWRCQVFEIAPGQKGTFWHTATTFTEDGDMPALIPPDDVPDAMVNVSAWIALEDVSSANGCLRFVPGSHTDLRLDSLLQRLGADRIGWVMSLDRADRRRAVTALRYSGDIFLTAQVAVDKVLELIPDLYEDATPTDFPMRAGECILFSSNNLHGSHGNTTDRGRMAFGVRFTSADVGIYAGQATIPYATGSRYIDIDATGLQYGIPVHTPDGPVARGT